MPEVAEGFPKLDKATRPWSCKYDNDGCTRKKPCRRCLGARSRRSGMAKQREARKVLERVTGRFAVQFVTAGGNEELWNLPIRIEVKSGAIAGPVDTKCRASEAQSEASRAVGDPRPFGAVFMPQGVTDGWFCCRLSQLERVASAVVGE